ncbi:MAG: methyltransferase domain-containing protein [Holdemanella biformis]|uniref:MerR family transcriptional regulator n=1 Tax=Holdemanella biformis TaxID=1735 RepID=UPI002432B7E2|nr:methyltransferase domain-containing protein [Holdemanella biformis]MBS6454534.1 methyltransferase domain-containing protein [Holdemanella biformis]
MNYYKTGQFARLANVSERTIRYYDKIGLLKPSFVMENGYRQYSDLDLLKLQKILSLKHLGFSIEEIFPMVMDNTNLKESFELQIDLIEDKISHLQSLKDALKRASQSSNLSWNMILSLVQLSNEETNIIEQYKNAKNLNDRISLHEKYSTNSQGWFNWLFEKIDFSKVNRLLELGCGNGKLWQENKIDLRNREIFLSDISEGMVEEVRNKLGSDFNCIVADAEKIPFKDAYFDSIIANHVLFYLNDLNQGLKEISRVLKPNGVLYCSTYGSNHMKEITDIVQSFDSRINLSNHSLYDVFGLENGESILKQYFTSVQRMDYQDSLEITESKPLIDYIMSCHGNQNEILGPRLSEFKEYIEELLQNDGKIVVTKQAGLFVCEK